jgi:O-antigen/teichoic acid export membrane protein
MVSTAWVSLLMLGAIAALSMVTISTVFPRLFPQIPRYLQGDAKIAMAWVGLSMAIGLPFSVFMGVFIGRQRHEVPAFIQVGSRLLTGIALIGIAVHHGTIVVMAEVFAVINLITYGVQFLTHRLCAGSSRIHLRNARIKTAKVLWEYCLSLSVWNVAMLMVTGLDLVIVGRVDFQAVPAYAIATGLVTFVSGLQNAVFSVLIPAGAILGAKEDTLRLQRMFLNATRYGMLLLMVSSLPLLLEGRFLLLHYLGISALAKTTLPLLQLLVIGNVIRLTATPYAVLLIGTGQQRIALLAPIVEGIVNLSSSIFFGLLIGAPGVAIGTIIGSIAGSLFTLGYNFPRTKWFVISKKDFIFLGLLRPIFGICPFLLIFWALSFSHFQQTQRLILYLFAVATSLLLTWHTTLSEKERSFFSMYILRLKRWCWQYLE